MLDFLKLPFGKFEVYENYIIGEPNAKQDMGISEAESLADQTAYHYNQPFGYIGNRINQNSVDPMAYLLVTRKVPLVRVMAVVSYSSVGDRFLDIERKVAEHAQLRFEVFDRLRTAKEWMDQTLKSVRSPSQ